MARNAAKVKSASAGASGRATKTSGRRQADRRKDSMALILDCAEAEFARLGYNGATLAGVATVAGVDTALMRYYFGDKERLFAAVFKRRAPASNALRNKAVAEYREAAGDQMTVEGLIEAYTRPAFELMCNDEGWRNYAAIVAYVNSSRGVLHELMSESFDLDARSLVADLRRVLPDAREQDLYWAYHFMSGAYTFSLGQTGRIDRISEGVVSSDDVAAIARRLPVVMAAGIRAMCEAGRLLDSRPFDPETPGSHTQAFDYGAVDLDD